MKRWVKWIVLGVLVAVALVYGAIFVYTEFINDPAPELSFEGRDAELAATTTAAVPATTAPVTAQTTETPATTALAATVDGTWEATEESEVGYRVKETLAGVDTEGVGRTNQITGTLTIEGTTLTAASFEVDMASVTSDSGNRDNQFRGRIMDVATHPTAAFVLSEPIDFGAVPDGEDPITATATGELTLRGTTNTVTFEVQARLIRGSIEVLGEIPVVFSAYGIPNPSAGPAQVGDEGLLEFLLVFRPA